MPLNREDLEILQAQMKGFQNIIDAYDRRVKRQHEMIAIAREKVAELEAGLLKLAEDRENAPGAIARLQKRLDLHNNELNAGKVSRSEELIAQLKKLGMSPEDILAAVTK